MEFHSTFKTITCEALILLLAAMSFVQCQNKKFSRKFFIDELDLYLNIEEINFDHEFGGGLFRINIYKSAEHLGDDYIEVDYKLSEMPSITLNFPLDNSRNIHVIDAVHTEVKYCKSKNFNIIYPDIDNENYMELSYYKEWCDSVLADTNSITINIEAYLSGLTIWNNRSDSHRRILPSY